MKTLLLATALLSPALPVAAQSGPVSPFEITCAQLMSPAGEDQRIAANMMVMWTVGYFYGRFGADPKSNLTPQGYDRAVGDLVSAMQQICPNVPEMTIADFAQNLAGDFQETLEQQE